MPFFPQTSEKYFFSCIVWLIKSSKERKKNLYLLGENKTLFSPRNPLQFLSNREERRRKSKQKESVLVCQKLGQKK